MAHDHVEKLDTWPSLAYSLVKQKPWKLHCIVFWCIFVLEIQITLRRISNDYSFHLFMSLYCSIVLSILPVFIGSRPYFLVIFVPTLECTPFPCISCCHSICKKRKDGLSNQNTGM